MERHRVSGKRNPRTGGHFVVEPRQRWKEIRSHCSCHRYAVLYHNILLFRGLRSCLRHSLTHGLHPPPLCAASLSAAWLRRESNGLLPGRIPRRRRIARASSGVAAEEASRGWSAAASAASVIHGQADISWLNRVSGGRKSAHIVPATATRFYIIISCFSVGYARAYGTRSPTAYILRRFARLPCRLHGCVAKVTAYCLAAFRVAAASRGRQAA